MTSSSISVQHQENEAVAATFDLPVFQVRVFLEYRQTRLQGNLVSDTDDSNSLVRLLQAASLTPPDAP
jgi:hypothetical protein